MNVLIAPDSFKGSLRAKEFCDIAEDAIFTAIPSANVIKVPLADGGEGTVEALVLNTKGRIIHKNVTGPLGNRLEAQFGILGDDRTAVVELASASGLPLIPKNKRNPMITTTYGTGEIIKEALDLGCSNIILGIGGSSTNDGGAGIMQALGFKLLDGDGKEISWGAEGLLKLVKIDTALADARLKNITVTVACDVDNPLYGADGAAHVYGPQKGADRGMVNVLDQALRNFAMVIQKDLGKDVALVPGAGAAGGTGAGLMAFLDARLKPGFEIIEEIINLKEIFERQRIDLVITGEGEINYQTVNGKLPIRVAKLAKRYGAPVVAVVGSIGEGAQRVYNEGIDSIISIINKPMDLDEAMNNASKLLWDSVYRLMRLLIL